MPYTEYIFLFKFCKKIYEQKFEKNIKTLDKFYIKL